MAVRVEEETGVAAKGDSEDLEAGWASAAEDWESAAADWATAGSDSGERMAKSRRGRFLHA